jgi:hypothetical protein
MNKRKHPRDINRLAASIVTQATRGEPQPSASPISQIARLLGRLGGLKGGPARAAALLPEQRQAIAKKAAKKRWGKRTPKS